MDVPVPCLCPPKDEGVRHPEGDTITLRDTLDFRTATAMRKSIGFSESDDEGARSAEIYAILTESYVLFGVEGWTVLDAKGKPVPVSHALIRAILLANLDAATTVADAADDLYKAAILLPLLRGASTSSPPTPTDELTSPKKDSSSKRPTPLKRSSTSTTPTDATEMTSSSLAGVSSSSQSSESAA